MKQLHKYFRDYTEKELIKIKFKHCEGCKHLCTLGSAASYSAEKKSDDESLVFAHKYCKYFENTGKRRIVYPDICPYGIKEEGIKLNEETHEKFVDFMEYCRLCKYKDLTGNDQPCDECLSHPTNFESSKPVNFKKKEQ